MLVRNNKIIMYFLTKTRIKTVIIAAIGAGIFELANIPLAFLFGPMVACLILALSGVKLQGLGKLSIAARTILGVAVGASVTPDLVADLPNMMRSLVFIPLYIGVIALIGVPFFYKICKLDKATAYYAAMPGGLQDMVIFGQEAGGNPRILSLIHATRVLIIVAIAPLLISKLFGASLSNSVGASAATLPWHEMLLMALAAFIGWKGGEKIKLFGAPILGPLIVTAILSLAGFIHYRPPAEAILAAQYFIGIGIGVNYIGVTMKELRRYVLSGVAFVIVLAILAASLTQLVVMLGFAEPIEAFLAFAPGGQAEMAVLAIVAGADLGFVVTHHLARIILVIICAPLAAKWLGTEKKSKLPQKPPD